MKYATYSIVIALCLLSSCKDEKPIAKSHCELYPGDCEVVSEGKKFFAFKIGSWWVYEEETSGERDSVYVTQSSINPDGYDFDIRMYSTLEGYTYHYWPMYASGAALCSTTEPMTGKCLYIKRSKGKLGDFVGEDNCFFVNYRVNDFMYNGGNIYFENNKIIVHEISPTFSIGDLNFEETVKIHELSTRIEGIQPTNHYFSKNVGLIKKELLDSNQTWNLVDYHIEP